MFDFCGLGNSCIDIVANVDDAFLQQWNFPKSICSYLDLQAADALEAALPSPKYIPGGCGANTAAIITNLGGKASFIGRVAKDAVGELFLKDMEACNIHYTGVPDTTPGAGSTRVFALITPDTERTFASYYGVQEDLSIADLDEDAISRSRFMYLDGYALNARKGKETFLKAAEMAHAAGHTVVFSPSDISILRNYPDAVEAVIAASDMILCNEQELHYIARTAQTDEALKHIQTIFKAGAVTAGEQGVYVFDEKTLVNVPAAKPQRPVTDTNGAGDAFAGGYLYGLAHAMGMEKAARLGHLCAASIITYPGARPEEDFKKFLQQI
ncbi:MAG: adenosine kinase [Micavibrio sp.]